MEQEITSVTPINDKLSADLGLKTTAKIYEGKFNTESKPIFTDFNLPDLLKAINKKLRKAQRELIKKLKGSKNRDKQRLKVA